MAVHTEVELVANLPEEKLFSYLMPMNTEQSSWNYVLFIYENAGLPFRQGEQNNHADEDNPETWMLKQQLCKCHD